ncbi:Extracellular protein SEL-1 and related proteins [Plasmopara halstedii]|uniref:Extracellular protein SEL-1 and related proteins n=1 Tax=Plasmopara halstedii TaxID=4781 RepID=A0A0P1A828_PLAHL|nr:Extracellular protein SEL-1 and related proteins [Plasmopara halstedii]CEG36789.1 Extracellular protein SEL-1 and related proteins [Plasmopara halstedii]|eukprot:XP_024573158.1 Extracellular protein SEL-1 and related proteins [Plasmopara halstedii]
MQWVLGAWSKSRGVLAKEGNEELQEVVAKLRKLGQRATLEEFKESPLVAKLKSSLQFHGLGNMIYSNAGDSKEEVQKALHVWKIAMEKGSAKAKFSYALCMKKGIGFPNKDLAGAVKHFKDLAATGHGWGTFAYADALSNGDGIRKNEEKAFELFKQCAEAGIPPAFMNISNMYRSGTGTLKNEQKALKWLVKAAEAGDPAAQSRLGECYSLGKGGVQKNQGLAVHYYMKAASAGVVAAQFNLGYLFLTGDGVPQDTLQAEALFYKAASKGFVMAMVNLAQMYRTGYGKVPKDLNTARKWLELAAPHDPNAKELLTAITESENA